MDTSPIATKESLGLLQLVYKDFASPGVAQVGVALSRTIEFIALPTLLLDWANKRASVALESNLDRYRERLAKYPKEEVAEVPPEIGVEILQKLSYVTDNDISDYFLNLLERASLSISAHLAHPRFIGLISALSPDEARLLKLLYRSRQFYWVQGKLNDTELTNGQDVPFSMWPSDYVLWFGDEQPNLTFRNNLNRYVDNLLSLGIILRDESKLFVTSDTCKTMFPEKYENVRSLNVAFRDKYKIDVDTVKLIGGSFFLTEIGKMFLDVCCASPNSTPREYGNSVIRVPING
jgi:hypothetical protein